MKVKTPEPGGICQSLQGRDKGRYYIVIGVDLGGNVFVTDGNFKRLASPKKKNLKHLRLLPDKAESIAKKFLDGEHVFDTEIYSALKSYNYPQSVEKTDGENN